MLEIEFNLEQPQTSWNAKIHQLNGDILRGTYYLSFILIVT